MLVCHEYGHAEDAYMGIYEAVKRGMISEECLNESVKRIVKAKILRGFRPAEKIKDAYCLCEDKQSAATSL